MTLQNAFSAYIKKFNEPTYDFNIIIARTIVCAFFIWKLLSRDFSSFGLVPHEAFQYYPIGLYARDGIIILTGLPIVIDIACFHWIHWFVPYPTESVFQLIQMAVIALLALVAVVGMGPKRSFAIAAYIGLAYLWGFVFRTGMEQDAVDMYMLALLVLIVSPHRNLSIVGLRAALSMPPNVLAGRVRSGLILVLVFYYFASGYNKLTDISPFQWFDYQLIQAIEVQRIATRSGHYIYSPEIFDLIPHWYWLGFVAVPMVYLSHLASPLVFSRRAFIFEFAAFYFVFHIVTFGVAISFTGYIFVWLLVFDFRTILFGASRLLRPRGSGERVVE